MVGGESWEGAFCGELGGGPCGLGLKEYRIAWRVWVWAASRIEAACSTVFYSPLTATTLDIPALFESRRSRWILAALVLVVSFTTWSTWGPGCGVISRWVRGCID